MFAADSGQITKFLLSQASTVWSDDSATPQVGELWADQLKDIDELLIDLDVLADLVREYCTGNFDEPEWRLQQGRDPGERVLEQFMYLVNKRMKGGAVSDSVDEVELAASEANSGGM